MFINKVETRIITRYANCRTVVSRHKRFCEVTQQTIIIINENNSDPIIVVAHIAHYTQNLMS
jgi:hypothetical protein